MKMICPGCGAIASADSWNNDANCRETLLVISRLPSPLPKAGLGYLSLFRPGKQSLTWKKALRLAIEIEELTVKGFVHVQGRIDRDCPARIWAQAMEQMVERRTGLTLPLPNHTYLSKVAWQLADEADAKSELRITSYEKLRKNGATHGFSPAIVPGRKVLMSPMDAYVQGHRDDKPSEEEMQAWHKERLS